MIKALALVAILASCTTMQKVGDAICEGEQQIGSGVTAVGNFFGTPGTLVAGGLNLLLSSVCKATSITLSAPKDATDDVTGIFTDPPVPPSE